MKTALIIIGHGSKRKDFDKAMIELERAFAVREVLMYYLKVDPAMDPIRSDPRFKALLKKMNLD